MDIFDANKTSRNQVSTVVSRMTSEFARCKVQPEAINNIDSATSQHESIGEDLVAGQCCRLIIHYFPAFSSNRVPFDGDRRAFLDLCLATGQALSLTSIPVDGAKEAD